MAKAYLEFDEVTRLEKAATNLRDRLLIRLPFHLGCGVSETLAITEPDIDLTSGTVTIQTLKIRTKLSCLECNAELKRSYTYCPKCGVKVAEAANEVKKYRHQRVLPINVQTLEMLKEYFDHGGPVERDGKRFLFNIGRNRAWQIVRECSEKAGLPKLMNPKTKRVHGISPRKLQDAYQRLRVKDKL